MTGVSDTGSRPGEFRHRRAWRHQSVALTYALEAYVAGLPRRRPEPRTGATDHTDEARTRDGRDRADRQGDCRHAASNGTHARSSQSRGNNRESMRGALRGGQRDVDRRMRVLVADSNPAVREVVAGVLHRAGFDVATAADAGEAVAVLEKDGMDAIVVSLRLPPGGCIALLDACTQPPPAVVLGGPTGVMHAMVEPEVRAAVDDPRVVAVLREPYKLQELYDAVGRAASPHER
jgi:CheY-like chemotaxis protein